MSDFIHVGILIKVGTIVLQDISQTEAELYLPFFKLNPEIKFCFGLTDILKHNRPDLDENPDMYKITQSLGKVKSKMVVITFYFE